MKQEKLKGRIRSFIFVLTAVIALSTPTIAMADSTTTTDGIETYKQSGNALEAKAVRKVPLVKNTKSPQKAKVKKSQYYRAPGFKKSPYETVANYVKPDKKTKLKFKTELFLPVRFLKNSTVPNFSGPQSVLWVDDENVYILYTMKENSNKCRIVKYNMAGLRALGLNKAPNYDQLRRAGAGNQYGKIMTPKQDQILSYITVGPEVIIGHGQSLAWNPVTQELWCWRDLQKSNGKWINEKQCNIQRINTETLMVDKIINFKMASMKKVVIGGAHNLAFDQKGNAYFVTVASDTKYMKIYKMKIAASGKVKVSLVQQVKKAPSKGSLQSLQFSPVTKRLYVVCDDIIVSFPVSRIGKLRVKDLKYYTFKTKREFEGIGFDTIGYGYLLTNRGPELMKSSKKM